MELSINSIPESRVHVSWLESYSEQPAGTLDLSQNVWVVYSPTTIGFEVWAFWLEAWLWRRNPSSLRLVRILGMDQFRFRGSRFLAWQWRTSLFQWGGRATIMVTSALLSSRYLKYFRLSLLVGQRWTILALISLTVVLVVDILCYLLEIRVFIKQVQSLEWQMQVIKPPHINMKMDLWPQQALTTDLNSVKCDRFWTRNFWWMRSSLETN